MTDMEHVAWTGGTKPGKYKDICEAERKYVNKLFQADCSVWIEYWKTRNIPLHTRDRLWDRARHDAHATFRHHVRENKT